MLEYCVLEDRTFLWLIWREGYRLLELPVGRERIERWAAALQARLGSAT